MWAGCALDSEAMRSPASFRVIRLPTRAAFMGPEAASKIQPTTARRTRRRPFAIIALRAEVARAACCTLRNSETASPECNLVCFAAARHSSRTAARQLLFEGIVAVDCVPCTPCICHMIYIWDMFTGPIRIPLQTPEYSGFDVCVESMRNTDIRLLNTSVSHAHNTQTHTIQPSKRGTRSQIEFPTL